MKQGLDVAKLLQRRSAAYIQHLGKLTYFSLVFTLQQRNFNYRGRGNTKEKPSGDVQQIAGGLVLGYLPQNCKEGYFCPVGALISKSVKYSELLTHFSLTDRVEKQEDAGEMKSLISRESVGSNP